ncbi:MAG: hypothetical protein Q7U47_10225 [Paludibacter sp.]|nr:hypothetical protein [Paludibacter sp.]
MIKNYLFGCCCILLLTVSCKSDKQRVSVVDEPAGITDTVIIDCNYTFEQATAGIKIPEHIIKNLRLITVKYYSMDGKIHQGQMITNYLK